MSKSNYIRKIKFAIFIEGILLLLLLITWQPGRQSGVRDEAGQTVEDWMEASAAGETIKWVDFNVTCDALCQAFQYDIDTYGGDVHLNWVELLAYLGAKYGGDFGTHSKSLEKDMKRLAETLTSGESTMEKLTEDMKYYDYYLEAYGAVLGGMVGEYQIFVPAGQETDGQTGDETDDQTEGQWQTCYGLKAFSPIARGFEYSHFDDFGTSRSYGYKRQHLGHDMMGQVGTPIIAIESGTVEAIGWNQYGGWRIGIRSLDKKRYYYYAHMRQNYPYAEGLEEGSLVTAGDVIGYMGHTGYSTKENVNNIEVTHLHWGMELIFDEERRAEGKEIWIDVYPLTQFLYKNRSEVAKVEGTKEWKRTVEMKDPTLEKCREE